MTTRVVLRSHRQLGLLLTALLIAPLSQAAAETAAPGPVIGSMPAFHKDHHTEPRKTTKAILVPLLAKICAPGHIKASGNRLTCTLIPDYDGRACNDNVEFMLYLRGKFTSQSGRNDVLISYYGCEPHANNWGGNILVQLNNKPISALPRDPESAVVYLPGVATGTCQKLRAIKSGGIDRLVCLNGFTGQGVARRRAERADVGDRRAR